MIDWFASKISMLIFVAVALSLLLGFLGMQLDTFDFEKRARVAEDITQLINTMPINGTIDYEVPLDRYNLKVISANKTVSVDGASRSFFAAAGDAAIENAKLLGITRNSTGYVNVSAK